VQRASKELRETLPTGTLITQNMINQQISSGFTQARVDMEQAQEQALYDWRAGKIEDEEKQRRKIIDTHTKKGVITPDMPPEKIEALVNRDMLDYYYREAMVEGNLEIAEELQKRKQAWDDKFMDKGVSQFWGEEGQQPQDLLPELFELSMGITTAPKEMPKTTLGETYPVPTISLEEYQTDYFKAQGWDTNINRATATTKEIIDFDQHTRMANEAYKREFGERSLVESQVGRGLSLLFQPARALRPEVKWEDITTAEKVFGAGQIALYIIAPATRMVPGVGGAILRAGTTGTAAAAFSTHTVLEWDNMTPEQRAISIGFDALLWASFGMQIPGIKTDIKVAKTYYDTPLSKEMPAHLRGSALDKKWKNLWVEINRVQRSGDAASMKRASTLYAKLKKDMMAHGYTPNNGWEPYTKAAFGQITEGVPATKPVADNVNTMMARTEPKTTLNFDARVASGELVATKVIARTPAN